MRRLSPFRVVAVALATTGLLAEAADPPPWVRGSYVSFTTLHTEKPLTVAGRLMVPRGSKGKTPAVLIVHGANGPDSRGPLMAEVLTKAGIATLEIDMWFPRGLVIAATSRPPQVTEALQTRSSPEVSSSSGDRRASLASGISFMEEYP
jgi:dienelactone hydrolase